MFLSRKILIWLKSFIGRRQRGAVLKAMNTLFGILMKGLCLTNWIGDGFKLLQVMKSREIIPNSVIYNTLLHALCRNGEVGRARSLMNEIWRSLMM